MVWFQWQGLGSTQNGQHIMVTIFESSANNLFRTRSQGQLNQGLTDGLTRPLPLQQQWSQQMIQSPGEREKPTFMASISSSRESKLLKAVEK
jgi:hypothetical protein